MSDIRNILIVRLSAVGDVIHAMPCLHALRRAYPLAHIGWVLEEIPATLLKGQPEVDALHIIPKKRWRSHPLRTWWKGEKSAFYAKLRETKWDVAVDFQGLTKSGWPAWRSGAPLRVGFGGVDSREINRFFINRKVVPPDEARHVIQRNLSLLEPLGIRDSDVIWRFPDFSEERREIAPFLQLLGASAGSEGGPARSARFIALYPGAGWETKRWPPERFAELARLLAARAANSPGENLPMVLVWGPGEENLCAPILKQANLPAKKLTMAPPTNLRQLAALLRHAAVAVGGDTGPMHLAAALGVPVVGIYAASDPVRNGPWGDGHRILRADESNCQACWRARCNNENRLECLSAVKAEAVADALREILARRR